MLSENCIKYIDDELYLENFDNKYLKIFDFDKNNDIMTDDIMLDDTLNAIDSLILMNDGKEMLDLSGLLLEGTFDIKNIVDFNKKIIIKKLDCSNNLFDTIIAYNKNVDIHDFEFDDNPVKKIYFPYLFNKNIDLLPQTLRVLIFPTNSIFNKPINDLPISLEILSVGNSFNQSINNLPNKLLHIMLGSKFNHPVNKLPPYLKTLIFNKLTTFEHELNCLPDSLEFISLPLNYDSNNFSLPNDCKYIYFNTTINKSKNLYLELRKKLETNCYKSITIFGLVKQTIYYK